MPSADSSSRLKILVVEDSYLTAAAVCDMVVKHGYDVAGTVGRVETGLKFVREHAVDGAVVDIYLHGATSFPICEQLKKRDIPFFFVTGYDRSYQVPDAFKTAPWLQKPIDDREFGLALTRLAGAPVFDGRGNAILDRLATADWLALQPHLERVSLAAGAVLVSAGSEVSHVHFPITALASISARNVGGKAVEVALAGRDGMTGIGLMLGKERSPGLETVVHVAGSAWRIAAADLSPLLERRPSLRAALLEAVHEFLVQVSDSVVSIGSATIERRLARRLLTESRLLDSRRLALTHEGLARLMAVRRSGITVALHTLEGRRLIRARRNLVEILDYEGLADTAGETPLNRTLGS